MAILVAVGLLIGTALFFLAAAFSVPSIGAIENEWGEISQESSEIETEVTVENPNLVGIPPILTLHYDVRLNSITMANGAKDGVGFPVGRSRVNLSTKIDNKKIAPWWRTHIERNEKTTLVISPAVSIRWLPIDIKLPEEREPVETAIIESLNEGATRPMPIGGSGQVVQTRVSADWGQPTVNRSPITLAITVQNRLDERISVEYIDYRILMNDVAVGAGELERDVNIESNGQGQIVLTVYIQNNRMNDWWVTHLRNDEVTQAQIEIGGSVRVAGTDRSRSFDLPVQNTSFTTDILG